MRILWGISMTDFRDHRPLSRVELTVLARLSAAKAPTRADIQKSLSQVGVPLTGAALEDCATAALAELKGRGLTVDAAESPSAKHAPVTLRGKHGGPSKRRLPRFALTDIGRAALRVAFRLKAPPTWKEACNRLIPALALGEQPGDPAADAALASVDAIVAVWLRRDRTLGSPTTVAQLCDQVIAKALGMPPGIATPAGIRAYALAKHCGVESKAEFERIASMFEPTKIARSKKSPPSDSKLKLLAAELAKQQLGVESKKKPTMVRALARHWVSQQDEADTALRPSPPWPTPLETPVTNATPPIMSAAPSGTTVAEPLLTAVREAIPKVGSDGRYGKENVFVSALWRQLARDQRLSQLSLDRFKQWLVAANRDQLLALARADLVDDMDARLVEDSEIEDLGETFHFVIDRRGSLSAPGQMRYAR